jgi:hypothetical protein
MSDLDPYQTPASSLDDTAHRNSSTVDAEEWSLASRWQRLGAWYIDFVFIGLASMILLLPLIWLDSSTRSDRRSVGLIDVLASVAAWGSYRLINGYWLAKDGQIVGKGLLGIKKRVCYETNTVLPLGHIILKRYLPLWLLSLIPVFGGALV